MTNNEDQLNDPHYWSFLSEKSTLIACPFTVVNICVHTLCSGQNCRGEKERAPCQWPIEEKRLGS